MSLLSNDPYSLDFSDLPPLLPSFALALSIFAPIFHPRPAHPSLVENGSFTTTSTIASMIASTTAFAVIQDTYDCYSVFDFVVIVDKSFRTT
jgi:hypothetical protein